MIGYIFVLCALAAGLTKGYCGKKTSGVITGLRGTVLFNAIRMLICIPIGALFVLFTAKGANFDVDALTLIISAVSGVSTAMFVVTWIGCVRVGAYMMVDVFITLGVMIPIFSTAMLFGEEIRLTHIIGLLLLIFAAYLMCSYNNRLKQIGRMNVKQLALLAVCGSFNGINQFTQKWLRYSTETEVSVYNFYTYIFAACTLLLLAALMPKQKSNASEGKKSLPIKRLAIYVTLMSACLFLHSFCSASAAGYLTSAQLYPLMQGLGLTCSMIMSAVCFGERITPRCVLGIVTAFAAMLCINLL